MKESFDSHSSYFGHIDTLLAEVEQSTVKVGLLSEIDNLCSEVDMALDTRKKEVEGWEEIQKRQEAADSRDPYVLNLLSMDESYNVRTLSACNPNTPIASLRRLAESADDYVRMVIANNSATPAEILGRIAELSSEQEVLDAVKSNPNVSPVVLYKIQNRMA